MVCKAVCVYPLHSSEKQLAKFPFNKTNSVVELPLKQDQIKKIIREVRRGSRQEYHVEFKGENSPCRRESDKGQCLPCGDDTTSGRSNLSMGIKNYLLRYPQTFNCSLSRSIHTRVTTLHPNDTSGPLRTLVQLKL